MPTANWVVNGLSALVVLAGLVTVRLPRSARPTAALFAVTGLLCILADMLLSAVIFRFYPRFPPTQGGLGGPTREQWQALDLGLLSLDHVISLVGAVGWAFVLVAMFVEAGRPRPIHRQSAGGVR
ncbi:hypothetical protein [Microlunatus parietis]|uniref:Uncharacterized protein n=1 Tax=Microlunatus parietis TaxID=682979 RepID=A0A7Y9I5V0_9ACTN|nr:hypothetical protein [Microlunatus parietis]NYE70581.1 hypothetical protein [Microlunatus parietis]